MKKVLLALPIFLLFLAPVFALTDLTTECNNNAGYYYLPVVSNEIYQLTGDVACTVDFGIFNSFKNLTFDFNGYTFTGIITDTRCKVNGLEIKNGNLVGHVFLDPQNQYTLNKIYVHDLNINTSDYAFAIGNAFTQTQGDQIIMERLNVISSSDILLTSGAILVKNSFFNCTTGAGSVNKGYVFGNIALGVQTYENIIQDGCTVDSYRISVGDINGGTIIILRNSSFPIEAFETGVDSNTIVHEEPLIITMKDQNSALISGVGVVRKTAGSLSLIASNWNPTPDADVGVNNGIATAFFAKNITAYGGHSSYPTYNLTVKSRGQAQSRLITFNSPSDQNFTLDFSSEDTGSNVVVDNRTVTEKGGNAITGIVAFLSPIVMFIVPFLLVI